MSDASLESRKAIQLARKALRRGDHAAALKWGRRAASLAPDAEEPWLILAAAASPRDSLDYLQKAFEINPASARARRGMQWAMSRLQESPQPVPDTTAPSAPVRRAPSETAPVSNRGKRRNVLLPVLLFILGCAILSLAAWTAVSNPALAAILSLAAPTQPPAVPHSQSWAYVGLPKPTYTPTIRPATPTRTPEPTNTPTPAPTSTPGVTGTPESAVPLETTTVPGMLQAVLVPDTPTAEYSEPLAAPLAPADNPSSIAAAVYGERWIDVDLSQQRVYAYEGDALVNSFLASTGTWQFPTVTGTYKIWIKLRSTTMTGPGYYLPNVPYTMYFYKGYGLHGTYWHNNFGTPMSHGCVNLRTDDAKWLYTFASVGTTVNVHY